MHLEKLISKSDDNTFNMTPMIDVVFLLIIFFMLVCQFIVAENFEVDVPDEISNSQIQKDSSEKFTTVSVLKQDDGRILLAVGPDEINTADISVASQKIANAIDKRLSDVPAQKRIVTLRIDENIKFNDYQYALSGIAQSSATDMKLSVFKEKTR